MNEEVDLQVKPGDAARAIIICDGKLLVMKRKKLGEDYTTLVGGRVEPGEKPEVTVIREVKEETGVYVAKPQLVFIEDAPAPFGKQFIYLCEYISGEPALSPSSEEYVDHQSGDLYIPEWISVNDLIRNLTPFRSERLRTEILDALTGEFPEAPKSWES